MDSSLTFATSATDLPFKPPEQHASTKDGKKAEAARATGSLLPARTRTLPLNQTVQPEEKRRIIGDTFIRVCNQVLESLGLSPPAAKEDVEMKSTANGVTVSAAAGGISVAASSSVFSSTASVSSAGANTSTSMSMSATLSSSVPSPAAANVADGAPVVFVAQGTLRPDLIESASTLASGAADAIKTHHNDTELVRQLRTQGRVIEPLKDFHKDEVRQLGRSLGAPLSFAFSISSHFLLHILYDSVLTLVLVCTRTSTLAIL